MRTRHALVLDMHPHMECTYHSCISKCDHTLPWLFTMGQARVLLHSTTH